MKNIVKIVFVISLLFFQIFSSAQNHADCINAIPVCFAKMPIDSSFGEGAYIDYQDTGSFANCLIPEKNSTFYYFKCNNDGNFGFEIQPGNSQIDYDWAVFDISLEGCNNLANYVLAGNTSGTSGPTGPNGLGSSYCYSSGSSQYSPLISVVSGNTYLVYISNYSGTYQNDSIDFTFSDTTVFSNLHNFTFNIDTCSSAPIDLHSDIANSYLWNTGDTTRNISVSATGIYYVDYEHVCGNYTDTFYLTLNTVPNQYFLPPDMSYCNQDSAIITPTMSFPSYYWHYNGSGIMPDTLYTGGEYIVHATDTAGCTYLDTLHLYFSSEIYNPEICAASVNYNTAGVDLYFEVFPDWMPMQKYEIYKFNSLSSSFQVAETQYPPNAGYFFDYGAGLLGKEIYYVIATDTCSNSTYDTIPQNSIFLEAEYQNPTAAYLHWSIFHHPNVTKYLIYAGNSPFALSHIQTNPVNDTGTVVANLIQNTYFQIVALVENNNYCSVDSVFSNIPYYLLGEDENKLHNCILSPNPVSDCFSINS